MEPMYKDSKILIADLILYLEFLKSTMKLGDLNVNIILGLLSAVLPKPNG